MCNERVVLIILVLKFLSINCVPDYKVEDYKKIIFFNEVLQQVEQPLKYEKWKQRGDQLQSNKIFYKEFNEQMLKFQQDYETGELLTNQNSFAALNKFQHKQAEGLFHFLFQPLDWETFVQNACWARQHINAHMFVYVFIMAALQRQYEHAMFLPKIYEILPRYFLNEYFVQATEEFESGNMLILQTLSELTKANLKQSNSFNVWQWWKQIEPYDQSWHALKKERERILDDEPQFWWRPVDYTRNEAIMNEHAKLSYFTEDVDWNAYWYSLNLLYPSFFMAKNRLQIVGESTNSRHGEFWLYCLQQLLTRYELERWSLNLDEVENFDWHENVENGYNPFLRDANGLSFTERENQAKLYNSMETAQMLLEARSVLEDIESSVEWGYYYFNGTTANVTAPMVANMLQTNQQTFPDIYDSQWYRLAHMFLTQSIDRQNFVVRPHVLLNYETMMRDPLFYIFHKRLVKIYEKFRAKMPAYTATELQSPALHILSAQLSPLETYFDLYDMDVSNLAHTETPQQRWTQNLLARQLRLAHKPFHLNVTIAAEKAVTAMLRMFLITYESGSEKFLELNKIVLHLKAGENVKSLNYKHYFSGSHQFKNQTFESLYLSALKDEKQRDKLWRQYDAERYCGLSTRLLLPRGSPTGLPMRLFLMVNELSDQDDDENRHIWWRLCTPPRGQRAFGFPFDRYVDETLLNSTNMYWKDVLIYHRDKI